MMGKGKIQSQELRTQMGEKLPIALQAMAKAAGVSMAGLEKLLQQGKLISSDMIPKFADALNDMIPNVDTDSLEGSLNRLNNAFGEVVDSSGFQSKYKSLIDWLTGAIKTAAANIKNIVVGIVTAISFVVSNGFSRVLKGWWSMADELTIGQKKLKAEMIRTEAERAAAEIKLNEVTAAAKIKLETAVGKARTTINNKVLAEQAKYRTIVAAADKADIAYAAANSSKKAGFITRSFNTIKIGAAKLVVSLKQMWNSFAPAIIISAIVAVVMHFKNIYNEAKRIKNIFSDYKKEAKNIGDTQEVKMLQAQLAIMNDKTKSQKEVNAAQGALQKMLGNEKLSQEQINKAVAKRIELLKEAARADFYAQKAVSTEDAIKSRASKLGFTEDQLKGLAEYKESPNYDRDKYSFKIADTHKENGIRYESFIDVDKAVKETIEDLKVLADAEKELANSSNKSNILTTNTPTNEPDDKALRLAEKRLESLRKLDEADRKRQIEKQKFDLNLQQKAIDNMDDSFEKRTKQTLLNLEKEKLSIEEYQNKLLKEQQDHAKNKYVSINGTDKGFESYFSNLKKNDFKDKNGISILPEGLRLEDIEKQVNELLSAARKAQDKGFKKQYGFSPRR